MSLKLSKKLMLKEKPNIPKFSRGVGDSVKPT